MTKILNGQELADFIKERQAKAVRGLRQAHKIIPKLAIIVTVDNPTIEIYMKYKQRYGADILIETEIYRVSMSDISTTINKLNIDDSVHGIIVQLPLADKQQTDDICNLVAPEKDVDGLNSNTIFDPATPTAILWLLAGYNIELNDKNIVVVGNGKLVGAPLSKMLHSSGYNVQVVDKDTKDIGSVIYDGDIIITATGSPSVLYPEMVREEAVVVDAGVASESGKTVGDVAPVMYERQDLTITPAKGGVGPLTICALFENVIIAARKGTTL